MVMCVLRCWAALLVLLVVLLAQVRSAGAQLIEGLESWSDATIGLSTTRWTGERVGGAIPEPRPASTQSLASRSWPVRVHAGGDVSAARMRATLDAAEESFARLHHAGFLTSFGDAGQGGSGERDLYLVHDANAASAARDATGNFSALDGTRAFALVDARLPSGRLAACVAQALAEAQLLELDPAESESVRRGSAAYFGWLIDGEVCEDGPEARLSESPLQTVPSTRAWLVSLSARQDRNRGTFLFDMWQFARQRTWEGSGLRGSPDLFEAIAKTLSLDKEDFELVAAELAEQRARGARRERTLSFSELPAFLEHQPLEVLGSTHVVVALGDARPGARLRAWSRGAEGGRYTLSATRLDALGRPLSRLELPPRAGAHGQLSIELDAHTFAVSIALTRMADVGVPDPDSPTSWQVRTAGLIVDVAP